MNQLAFEYDDLGNLFKEYQEHEDGGVDVNNTLYVEYVYDTTSSSNELTKGMRLTSVKFPNGDAADYSYGSGANDCLNRISAINDRADATLASYDYLGLARVVKEELGSSPAVALDYTGSNYAAFDAWPGRRAPLEGHQRGRGGLQVRLRPGEQSHLSRARRADRQGRILRCERRRAAQAGLSTGAHDSHGAGRAQGHEGFAAQLGAVSHWRRHSLLASP